MFCAHPSVQYFQECQFITESHPLFIFVPKQTKVKQQADEHWRPTLVEDRGKYESQRKSHLQYVERLCSRCCSVQDPPQRFDANVWPIASPEKLDFDFSAKINRVTDHAASSLNQLLTNGNLSKHTQPRCEHVFPRFDGTEDEDRTVPTH